MTAEEDPKEAHAQSLSRRTSLVLVAAIGVGIAAAWLASGPIFHSLRTDISRVGVLLDALADDALEPKVVAFGNSAVMAGIDAGTLREQLIGKPRALNLGTNLQSLIESYLYYQELPDSVGLVIQTFNPWAVTWGSNFTSQRYNALFMYGYRPDPLTRATIEGLFGDELRDLFDRSSFRQHFDSRWAVHQTVERFARNSLRNDLDLDRANSDLYFPRTGARRLPDSTFFGLMERRLASVPPDFEPTAANAQLLREYAIRARKGGRRIVFLLMPVHPAESGYLAAKSPSMFPELRAFYRKLCDENGIPLIDAMDLLPDEMFHDSQHADEKGAAVLSSFLARELNALIRSGELRL